MARIIVEIPDHFRYAHKITLTDAHMNIGNHLDNALLLTLVSEARIGYWQRLGYNNPFDIEGVGNIVSDVAVQYKSEAFENEVMIVELTTNDFHKYGFDIVWRISDQASGREVARGKHGMLCFDVSARKVVLLPEKLKAALQADQPKAAL